jgi:hypothetical protein
MSRSIFSVFLVLLSFSVFSQDKEFDKLLKFYIDEDYERCANKAYKMTQSDKFKKLPEPYLYVAMANFEMSRNEKYYETQPKAFNEALKYAVKYRKKDPDGLLLSEYSRFFDELRDVIFETAENHMDMDENNKALKLFKSLVVIEPENAGAHLFKAYNETKMNLKNDARNSLEEFYTSFEAIGNFDLLPPDMKRILKKGAVLYANQLKESGNKSVAKEIMNKVYRYYEDDEDFKRQYDMIMDN